MILESCRRVPHKTALIDASCARRISYAEYGELVESLARGLVASGLKPGEVIAIYLSNSWEFCVTFHAASLCGAIPTLLNPSYREREVRYQLENSGAAFLITDGPNITAMNFSGLSKLRRIYTIRTASSGAEPFSSLLSPSTAVLPRIESAPDSTVAALPYSSGTTGLPKGVMLSHTNLVSNVFQFLGPNGSELCNYDTVLCFLPLYHIYGLNVILDPVLTLGATLVLVPRFHVQHVIQLMVSEGITMMPLVPPAMNAMTHAAEAGEFPARHNLRWVKCGAAPLAGDVARRFTEKTGVLVCQGYGMTEASPVTHVGYLKPDLYRPDSIGHPMAQTECRVLDDEGAELSSNQSGELVMRGPQFMLGYWKEPDATAGAMRDGWYWSGDVVTRDDAGFYKVVDRRKEMIKYKGFPIAPAEVEAVLLEHPGVKECGVVGRADSSAGEIPIAFVALRDGFVSGTKLGEELCDFVAQRITAYKQPREIKFVDSVPKTASGKILRRELRQAL
jgi:acyl-CoA synthetase (AMP-forming)/AMP-acid ligase II